MSKSNAENLGSTAKGIVATIEGNDLVLRIGLGQDFGPSKSGKTKVVATTSGTVKLSNGMLLGVNLNRK